MADQHIVSVVPMGFDPVGRLCLLPTCSCGWTSAYGYFEELTDPAEEVAVATAWHLAHIGDDQREVA